MIRSVRGLLLVATLTIVLGLIVLFPARIGYKWLAPAEFRMSGIGGTVWRGYADAADANGFYLRDLQWRIRPLHLLKGTMLFSVEAAPASGFMDGEILVGLSRSVTVEATELTVSMPLQLFEQTLNVRGLSGNASVKLDRMELVDGFPIALDGVVEVANLVVPVISRSSIGGYQAEFFTQNDGITASLEDTGGALDLAGSLQLKEDRSYEFVAQLVARANAPEGLKAQLRYLPPANDRGQQELRIEGSL